MAVHFLSPELGFLPSFSFFHYGFYCRDVNDDYCTSDEMANGDDALMAHGDDALLAHDASFFLSGEGSNRLAGCSFAGVATGAR